jgi:uncharacterized protein (DUF58 family)
MAVPGVALKVPAPRTEAVPPEVIRLVKQVEIKARILADEALVGTYRSVFRGSGLDFEEVREYEPGDDIRTIDWNVTARMSVPYIKKYREERELNIYLAVDVSSSAWFGTAEVSKRELAADVAALLAVTALHNNDRVGLVLFADGVREFLPPRQGRHHLLRVIRELLFAEPRRSGTELGSVTEFLANVTKKRNVVFVVSDFLDVEFEAPLRALGHKHDVIALILNDPRETELPSVGLVTLEDAERGGVAYVDTSDPAVRERFMRLARERRAQRLRTFSRMGVDRVELSTDRPYVPALLALFNARSRRN